MPVNQLQKFANMSSFKVVVVIFSVVAALLAIGAYYALIPSKELPTITDGWWGKGEKKDEDDTIKKINIAIPDVVLEDLKQRLAKTRFFETLEGAHWEYGANQDYMKELVKYWIEKYDWRAQENLINSYENFETKIEGIKVHFWHIKPQLKQGQKLIPIMFIHGWPGSFFEFYKLIPLLIKESGDFAYEIICPSIPGFGFSEPPHRPDFSALSVAGIFIKLMARLKHSNYYVQGGDWGSFIARIMAFVDKSKVKGVHLNMFSTSAPYGPLSYAAGYFLLPPKEHKKIFPIKDLLYKWLLESGYLHLQVTRPDSVGMGLNDSPAGLAAYIVEKFFVGSGCSLNESSSCLESYFTKDELITNIMIYWMTKSITSSMRLYKETLGRAIGWSLTSLPVEVPTGLAECPREPFCPPKTWVSSVFVNLVQYTEMARCGHFAAFEEPELLVKDVVDFVQKVEAKP